MTEHPPIVIVGRVGKAMGIKGWVRLVSFTSPPDNLLQYQPWLMQKANRLATGSGG